ncbi:hypothetical protein PG991_009353 [Apiospora marii]|uniref:Zn(2)-C6 fungal-type domain-containing protein n=1 Tax=Apiospora marii TaxID=335849 RepID=A0ABR1RLP8_9PEZI
MQASTDPSDPFEPTKKRKLAPLACERCRSHKTKCDSHRPSCGRCRARHVDCIYNDDPKTTTANLRRQYHHLAEKYQSFHELFEMLRSKPEDEAIVILQRLRASGDVQSILDHVKAGYLLTNSRGVGTKANAYVPFSPCPNTREEVMFGSDHSNAYPFLPPLEETQSALGAKMRNILYSNPDEDDWATVNKVENARHVDRARELLDDRFLQINASDWTSVAASDTTVRNLISLYLSWDHATMRLFYEELFLDQMSTGKRDYCSPVFVNALLAAATLNYSAIDHELCRDLGNKFFEEARQLWESNLEQRPRLLLVPTATLLGLWCYSNGDEKAGLEFCNESVRISIDLGLFRTRLREPTLCDNYARTMIRGETIVAWGLFNWHSVYSFFRRRRLGLPNPPYHLTLSDSRHYGSCEIPWNPFPLQRNQHNLHRDLTSRTFSVLWTIIWEGTKRQPNVPAPETHDVEAKSAANRAGSGYGEPAIDS